ncbi:putative leader peptide [Streptomyces sp. NPDC017993]
MGPTRLDSDRAVCAAQPLPLLTSRRHIDLLRVSSATSPLR